MDRHYDMFEVLPDGILIWRDSVAGHDNAINKLREYATMTDNEVRVMHLETNAIIATMYGRSTVGPSWGVD